MTTADAAGLAALPAPRLVEEIDFEAILARRELKFAELAAAHGLPEMADDLVLESAPAGRDANTGIPSPVASWTHRSADASLLSPVRMRSAGSLATASSSGL